MRTSPTLSPVKAQLQKATTMTTTKPDLLTADDLLRLSGEGFKGELIRGALHETMPAGVNHGRIVVKLVLLMGAFVMPRRLGTLLASDTGILLERDPDTVREPDIAYISSERLPIDEDVPGYSEIVPDLVVEVASPNDSLAGVRRKALMWLDHGVRLVWAARPDGRAIDIYQADGSMLTLTEDDTLDGGETLPGFTCLVSDIFAA